MSSIISPHHPPPSGRGLPVIDQTPQSRDAYRRRAGFLSPYGESIRDTPVPGPENEPEAGGQGEWTAVT
jgi:hypothetical protein